MVGGTIPAENDQGARSTVAILAIGDDSKGLCTGTIVGPDLILTAAHCIRENTTLEVVFGASLSYPEKIIEVSKIAVHALFEERRTRDFDRADIALLKLSENIPANYKIVPLLPKNFNLRPTSALTILGYGTNDSIHKVSSGDLHSSRVRVSESLLGTTEFITDQSQGSGICFGDSGGPAFVQLQGQLYLVGVASRVGNDGDDKCSGFAIYAYAGKFTKFLEAARLNFHQSPVNE